MFYKSWHEAIKQFPAEVQGEIYTAIFEYGLYGNETHDMGKVASAIWTLIKPQINANTARYENSLKGGAPRGNKNNPNGRRGKSAEPTENKPNNQPRTNLELTENQPNEYVNEHVNVRASEGLFPSLNPLVSKTLDPRVCGTFENYVRARSEVGIHVGDYLQELILGDLMRCGATPEEQIEILECNIRGINWKKFVIPEEVKCSIAERAKPNPRRPKPEVLRACVSGERLEPLGAFESDWEADA